MPVRLRSCLEVVGNELFSWPAVARLLAASTKSLAARLLFGFLSAEMASLSSASTFAFLCAFRSVPLKLTLRAKSLDGRSLNKVDSALGTRPIRDDSLASRFSPGITVWLADRSRAMVAAGPCETLRLLRSTERARSRVLSLSRFKAVGRFIGAPGFTFTTEAGFAAFSFGGDCATGPPSLRFKESHGPGRRAEKLSKSISQHRKQTGTAGTAKNSQRHDDIHTKVPQGVGISTLRFFSLATLCWHLRLGHRLDFVQRCRLPDAEAVCMDIKENGEVMLVPFPGRRLLARLPGRGLGFRPR